MKAKLVSTAILLLMIGWLKSDATIKGYSITFNSQAEDEDYYDPEVYYSNSSETDDADQAVYYSDSSEKGNSDPQVYYCDATETDDEDYEEADEPKYRENDVMYGAFKIITKPKGADVNLYDADMYLSSSPTPVYPVVMDESMELKEGIPGRTITLMITKKGYKPMKKDIFVPFMYKSQARAIDNPTVFKFDLKKDRSNSSVSICLYYSYANRHHRFRHHHNWFGAPSQFPWCPPGFIGWFYPPQPPHPGHGPHHGDGHNPPPPPPGGGHHHDGDGHNPPPPPPGGGHHGSGSGHGDNPPSPPGSNGTTNPPNGVNPQVNPNGTNPSGILTPKPNDSGTNPWGTINDGGYSIQSTPAQPKPVVTGTTTVAVSYPPVKPRDTTLESKPRDKEQPKPKPTASHSGAIVTVKPPVKPNSDVVVSKPVVKEQPKPRPEVKKDEKERPAPAVKPVVKKDHTEKPTPAAKPEVKKDKEDKQESDTQDKPKTVELDKKILKILKK